MVHLSRVELNIARQLYKDELWESRKIKFCDVGEVEEYFLRRRVCDISISGVVVAFFQQREKNQEVKINHEKIYGRPMDMWHGVMMNFRNGYACVKKHSNS